MLELKNLVVGLVTVVSGRWPKELPAKRHEEYFRWMLQKFPGINLVKSAILAVNNQDVENIVDSFKKETVDLVIVLIGAFTGDYAACYLAEELKVPLVLWAPREPQFDGGRLMANSLVAATMNAAALKRLGADYHFIFGDYTEKRVEEQITSYIKAYGCVKKLKSTYLGLLGYRPTGFYSSTFDETLIRQKFGIKMEEFDLKVLLDMAEKIDSARVNEDIEEFGHEAGAQTLPEGYLENHCRLYAAMNDFINQQGFNAVSLKCWPELGQLHYTPCAVISRFSEQGFVIGCESDVDATITMLVQKYLTGWIPFMCDLISIDEEQNTVLLWHCGQAARSLKDPDSMLTVNNHPLAGQGVVFETTLKSGTVTIARMAKIGGAYKLFITKGTAVPTHKMLKGVMVNVKLESPVLKIIYEIAEQGIPHHYSVVWGEAIALMELLCRILKIEVIKL